MTLKRGDLVGVKGYNRLAVVRYSAAHGRYAVAFVRSTLASGFLEPVIFVAQACDESRLTFLSHLDEQETVKIENYANVNYEIDRLKFKNKLSDQEKSEFMSLVDSFAAAKTAHDFPLSDSIREELNRWQSNTSDQDFINMADSGRYRFHPWFDERNYIKRAA